VHRTGLAPSTCHQSATAAVRRFTRSTFGDHASRDDAVIIASELAGNAIAHSQSGQRGGTFGVHLAVLNARFVVVVVTDQGGPAEPQARDACTDADSGRGLHIVRTLATGVVVTGGQDGRSIAALVPATPDPAIRPDNPPPGTLTPTQQAATRVTR
jgi:serine/threonine-protein kinase RsbW